MNLSVPMVPASDRHIRVVRFGVYEVDLHRNEIRKHGLRIKLRNQPFLVLAALLEKPGEVVEREELYELLWPGQTFVDFEHNLNAIVKSLRRALGDTAETPRYIETLVRRGYRFVAPVTVEVAPPVPGGHGRPVAVDTHSAPRSPGPAPKRRPWLLVAAVALLAILMAGSVYWAWIWHPAPLLDRLSAPAGRNLDPAFSPDGRWVAYASDAPDGARWNIFVQEIGSTTARRVTNYKGDDCAPAFSPDGLRIAFTREHRELMVVPALGGPERMIAPVENDVPMGLDYAPDGKSIATVDRIPGTDQFAIFLVSAATGEKRQLTIPPAGASDGDFRFSPDGRSMAFARGRSGNTMDVYVMPSAGGTPRRITNGESYISGLAWTEDGRDVVIASERSGSSRLWRVPVAGGTSNPLPEAPDGVFGVASSRSGHRLAYALGMQDVNIWSAQLSQPGNRPGRQSRLIASSQLNHHPQFSPDGKWIAFSSDRSGSPEIWLSASDGTGQKPITSLRGAASAQWSPDSKQLAFDVFEHIPDAPGPAAVWSIYTLDIASHQPRRILRGPNCEPSWSRDGEWIYFCSLRGGPPEIWRMRPDGSREQQLTHHGGSQPIGSPDGQSIFYEKPGDHTEVWKVPTAGGNESPAMILADGTPVIVVGRHWAPFPDGIYFLGRTEQNPVSTSNATDRYQIGFFGFATSSVAQLGEIGEYSPHPGGLSVSPDRRTIAWGQIDRRESHIILINNFR